MILRWGQVFGDFLPKHDYKWLMSVLQIYLKITIILLSDTIPNGADCLDGEKGNFLKAFSCSWIFFYSGINTPKLNNHREKERYHTHNKKGPNPKRKGDKIR